MSTLVPVINLPNLYIDSCILTVASNNSLLISTGQCRDSSDTYDIVVNSNLSIASNISGAGGLDTGTIAASTWYAVYLLFDPTNALPVSSIISASFTVPLMPTVNTFFYGASYSAFRKIGYVRTDSSSNFLAANIIGNGNIRRNYWQSPVSVLSGGTATTLTAINCNGGVVPLPATEASLNIVFSANAGTPLTLSSSLSGSNLLQFGTQVSAVNSWHYARLRVGLVSSVPTIYYSNGAGSSSTTVNVTDFEYFI